jgi:uncharacterized C2H2 Zn-finger protein
MEFNCVRCGYSSKYKHALINHLNKKNKCNTILSNIDRKEILKEYTPHFSKILDCPTCEQKFSSPQSLSKHKKLCSKKLFTEIKELKKKIKTLENKNNSIVNNTQNNNCNNTINNININAYGTHTPTLTYNELEKLLKIGARSAITRLIETNHFNKDKPENMNFYISNYKDNIGRVYDGETWIMKDGDELVNEIYDLYQSLVDNLIEDITYYSEDETEQQNFKEKLLDKINDTIDTWCKRTNNNKFIDGLKEDLKKHFYSKKAVVKKVHNIKGA